MMVRSSLFALLCAGSLAGVGYAQSLNIDYGDEAGTPSDTFAAAGLPGVWNVITEGAAGPVPLFDFAGDPTDVTVSHNLIFGGFESGNPATTGEDELLMDDFVTGIGDVVGTFSFAGLEPGEYQVIVYGWSPEQPIAGCLVLIDGATSDDATSSGKWPGGYVAGTTHTVHEITIDDGTLDVGIAGVFFGTSAFVNGIQLIRSVEPADFNGDGVVNGSDLLILLNSWGVNKNPSPTDLNGDGSTNGSDLLMLLNAWG